MLRNHKRAGFLTAIIAAIILLLPVLGNIQLQFDMGKTERLTNFLPAVGIGAGIVLHLADTCISKLTAQQKTVHLF